MATSVSDIDSKVISSLRIPLAFMVVLWHSVGFGMSSGISMSYHNGIFDAVKIMFSEGLCLVSVPIFFVISGYLFEAHFKTWNFSEYKSYIKRKLSKLVVPFLLWNVICFLIGLLALMLSGYLKTGYIDISFIDYFKEKGGFNIFAYGNKGYPIDYPLWFIRDLLFVNLLYPLLRWLCKWGGYRINNQRVMYYSTGV